jgi:hypothetical protein
MTVTQTAETDAANLALSMVNLVADPNCSVRELQAYYRAQPARFKGKLPPCHLHKSHLSDRNHWHAC